MELDQLAERETRVAKAMEGVSGYIEDRIPQVAALGVEDEYRSIFNGYLDLIEDPEQGLEALKRAVFLAWYSFAEPSWLTGLGDLPDYKVRSLMQTLDATLAGGSDTELIEMLKYYIGVIPLPFDQYPQLQNVQSLIRGARAEDTPRRWRPSATQGRGEMGDYWKSLRSDD